MISRPSLPLASLLLAALTSVLSAQENSAPEWPILKPAADRGPLPGTEALTAEGDLTRQMMEGIDRFLDGRIAASVEGRATRWRRDAASPEAYAKSVAPNREHLAKMLGLDRDARPAENRFEFAGLSPGPLAEGDGYRVYRVRWTAIGAVEGRGLLLVPDKDIRLDAIALPDADVTPEALAGLTPESPCTPYAAALARAGCRVLVPMLIDRNEERFQLTQREWLHRPAFELGRHLIGYELHKIFAGLDCLAASRPERADRPFAIAGWGEGGLLSLYAAALDERIAAACVSGYFGPREALWTEPAEHNVFGLLREFGDAEIASLIAPRPLVIEHGAYPDFVYRPDAEGNPERLDESAKKPGKPGRFRRFTAEEVKGEADRLRSLVNLSVFRFRLIESGTSISAHALTALLEGANLADAADMKIAFTPPPADAEGDSAPLSGHRAEQAAQIDRHNQWALIESRQDRANYFADLKTDSLGNFEGTIEPYREKFRAEVVGAWDLDRLPPNARSRKLEEGPKTVSYEVTLDVFPDVFAYGILTLPKDLKLDGQEKRPVVVCQHGLEGRPQDVVGEEKFKAYKAFATRLA